MTRNKHHKRKQSQFFECTLLTSTHKCFKHSKLHKPVGLHWLAFEKLTRADLSQIARDKSCDYLYKWWAHKCRIRLIPSLTAQSEQNNKMYNWGAQPTISNYFRRSTNQEWVINCHHWKKFKKKCTMFQSISIQQFCPIRRKVWCGS